MDLGRTGTLGSEPGAALHDSAVGKNRGGGDVIGSITGQASNHREHLLGLGHMPHRNGSVKLGQKRPSPVRLPAVAEGSTNARGGAECCVYVVWFK
jgi:hypothetical protein